MMIKNWIVFALLKENIYLGNDKETHHSIEQEQQQNDGIWIFLNIKLYSLQIHCWLIFFNQRSTNDCEYKHQWEHQQNSLLPWKHEQSQQLNEWHEKYDMRSHCITKIVDMSFWIVTQNDQEQNSISIRWYDWKKMRHSLQHVEYFCHWRKYLNCHQKNTLLRWNSKTQGVLHGIWWNDKNSKINCMLKTIDGEKMLDYNIWINRQSMLWYGHKCEIYT